MINSIAHSSVIAAQLLIGNIEANPGPMDTVTYMAELISNVENEQIRKVLQQFKSSQERKVNIQKVESMKAEDLKATLVYLNNWDPEDDLIKNEMKALVKLGLAEKIVRRLEILLPDTCSTCRKTYSFHIEDVSFLTCIRCDRGVCPDCFSKEEEHLQQSQLFRSSVHFLCTNCVQTVKSENVLKEHCFKKHKQTTSDTDVDSDENEVINLDSADNVEENAQTAEEVPNDESGDEKSKKCKDNTNQGSKKVCFHFTKYNNCKHGISGRTCKFEHPKTCQKYSSMEAVSMDVLWDKSVSFSIRKYARVHLENRKFVQIIAVTMCT